MLRVCQKLKVELRPATFGMACSLHLQQLGIPIDWSTAPTAVWGRNNAMNTCGLQEAYSSFNSGAHPSHQSSTNLYTLLKKT